MAVSAAPTAAPFPERSPWVGFSAVAVGTFMATIDGSIVNVVLPTLRRDLGTSIGGAEWVVTSYLFTVTATLLLAGRLGDVAGHRRTFVGGLLLFTAGSGLCAFAPGLQSLVLARAVQALGAAAMLAIAPGVVTALFPAARRGRALGAVTSVVAVGLTAGPPLGGLIVEYLSWRWVFFVNLPVGVAGAIWASRVLPALASAGGERPPLLDLALFRRRAFSVGIGAGYLSYAALFTATLLNPFYLATQRGLGPRELGAMMVIVPLAIAVGSPVAGWLTDHHPSRLVGLAGMLLVGGGLLAHATTDPAAPLWVFGLRQVALGLGMGLFQPPNNTAVMGALPRERLGAGGGVLGTSRHAGMATGVAAAGALFRLRAGSSLAAGPFLLGYRAALLAGAGLALSAGITSLFVEQVPAAGPAGRRSG